MLLKKNLLASFFTDYFQKNTNNSTLFQYSLCICSLLFAFKKKKNVILLIKKCHCHSLWENQQQSQPSIWHFHFSLWLMNVLLSSKRRWIICWEAARACKRLTALSGDNEESAGATRGIHHARGRPASRCPCGPGRSIRWIVHASP